jgi:hypothetical protein
MEVGKGECLTYNLAIDYVTVLRGFGGGGGYRWEVLYLVIIHSKGWAGPRSWME